MMKALYQEGGASLRIEIMEEEPVLDFIVAHASVLDSSFANVGLSDTMRARLQESDYIFSGMKAFHELNEAFPSLLDEDGSRKPFERFLNDVQDIDETYNRNYLRAEYNFAQASAEMADRWEGFDDGDDYLLEYRTAGDSKVRPEHAELHGVVRPKSDSFWDEYFPPNGWNCRCTVVEVLRSTTNPTDRNEALRRAENALKGDKKGMFRFNPGKEGKAFPDYNPYTISKCKTCTKKLTLAAADNELCQACRLVHGNYVRNIDTIKEGKGEIHISRLIDREDSDFPKLLAIAKHFAKDGAVVELTPKMARPSKFRYECVYGSLVGTRYEGKCPDMCVNGVWYEHEGFVSTNPKNAFRNMLHDGLKQSDRLIIDKPDLTDAYMKRVIRQRMANGQQIQEIWLRDGDNIRRLL